jgi:NAD(P)-dependent dehydrogenase (short-subunit alcohol dehydrogenase family)
MAGRMDGKVAFVTGAARGQGRSHAVRLAQEGADIIAVDICRGFDASPADGATPEDLDVTAGMVKDAGGRVVTAEVDVRDYDALRAAVDSGSNSWGGLMSSSPTPASVRQPESCTRPTRRCGRR